MVGIIVDEMITCCSWLITHTLTCNTRRCTEWACGKRYAQLLCTEHSPLVQVLYIALVIGGTTLYWSAIHPYLPVPFAPAYHK